MISLRLMPHKVFHSGWRGQELFPVLCQLSFCWLVLSPASGPFPYMHELISTQLDT